MSLKLSLSQTDIEIIASLNVKGERLMTALVDRMTLLMQRLQAKIRDEKLSGLKYGTGRLAQSISNPRAEQVGTSVVGTLDWGQGVPYARIQEFGGSKDLYVINPLGVRGTRSRIKGTSRRFGKDVLKFIGADGKTVYAPQVFHPRIEAKHFMSTGLEEMKSEIVEGLKGAIMGVMLEKR